MSRSHQTAAYSTVATVSLPTLAWVSSRDLGGGAVALLTYASVGPWIMYRVQAPPADQAGIRAENACMGSSAGASRDFASSTIVHGVGPWDARLGHDGLASAAGIATALAALWRVQGEPGLSMGLDAARLAGVTAGADVLASHEPVIAGLAAGTLVVLPPMAARSPAPR